MLTPPPPAEVQPRPLPTHVYAGFKETRKAAVRDKRDLICIIPEDQAHREAAEAFLNSLAGARVRSYADIWLASPGQKEITSLLEKAKLRSLPALVQLDFDDSTVMAFLMGEDAVPSEAAFRRLRKGAGSLSKPLAEAISEWAGSDAGPFLDFGKARKKDLAAGAKEPYRSWLVGLAKVGRPQVRLWASTRLVEADARLKPGEPQVFSVFLKSHEESFLNSIQNRKQTLGPMPSWSFQGTGLGNFCNLDPKAPCWPAIRARLRGPNPPPVGTLVYALMAPVLTAEDRDWVLRSFISPEASGSSAPPWNSTAFWLGTDWLLAYGSPQDWQAFEAALPEASWREALHEVQGQVEQIPAYWNTSGHLQGMFCDGESREAFWKEPDACLAAWGVTRENLISLGLEQVRLVKGGISRFLLKYPAEARARRFTGTVSVQTLVDGNGKVLGVRPLPGYALCFFAPLGLKYAAQSTFQPARVAGVGRPSQFVFTFPFTLH